MGRKRIRDFGYVAWSKQKRANIDEPIFMNKIPLALLISSILIVLGFILRLHAHTLAWAGVRQWSNPASDTVWGKMEMAYAEGALVVMGIGGMLLAITFTRWLFSEANKRV
jgi:hypothetical protein